MTLRERRGYTLAEALSALLVAGLLTLGLAAVLALVGRVAARHARIAAAAETERTTPAILGAELRALTAADATFDADSVRLRAFRGGGAVCERVDDELTIAWRGVRAAEPEKDSALVVWEESESAHRVESVSAGACDGVDAVRIRLSTLPDDSIRPLVAFIFETGAYSVGSAAFRYRRGSAGRQPLTEETLSTRTTMRLRSLADGGALAEVILHSSESVSRHGVETSVAMPQGGTVPPSSDP